MKSNNSIDDIPTVRKVGGGYPFSYEAGVNMPKAIIQWVKGEKVYAAILKPEIGKMFAKNDYLVEVG